MPDAERVKRFYAAVMEPGGRILAGPKDFGGQGRYCVIEGPAGAMAAPVQRAG